MKNTREIDRKLNALIKKILEEEDQENNITRYNVTQSEACPEDCEKSDNTIKEVSLVQKAPKQCHCAIENSSRFSLRVMEAIRALQYSMKPCTVEKIVDYIRTNYCHDGDLYSQVRTALRQVCSQRFVIKLLGEYHLIGPIPVLSKQNGCRLHYTTRSRMIDKTLRKRKNLNNNRCLCKPISKLRHQSSQSKYQNPKMSRKESLKRTIIDRIKNRKYSHSTRISANEMDKANYHDRKINFEKPSSFCDDQNNYRQHDITKVHEMEQKGECLNPIPGSSKKIVKTSVSSNARKKARENRAMKYASENDEKIMMRKDCICDTCAVQIKQDANLRKQLSDHARVVNKNQRNAWRYENAEEEKEDEEDKKKKEEEEEEDANTEDSAYKQLRKRNPCRTRTRERELKRWIQRCRKECERHNTRKK